MVELSRDDSCACRGLHVLNAAQVLEEGEDAKLQVGYSTDRSPLLGQLHNGVAFDYRAAAPQLVR
ncbi:ZFP36L1 [Symbiodinium natans]|uniref:ZFP36L1 protein n=1 Tax=Symbiodinium natans TaxID=878477 RepID=A0A812TUB1_9DINO|nr:ZFP36L1 [Symbiodinium natans]